MNTRTFTFSSTHNPWAIGFDGWFDRLSQIQTANEATNYPPYNIIKHDPENWTIEIAVAGFKRSDLDVELAEGVLSISGSGEKAEDEPQYIHRGLAKRAFTRKWTLAEDVIVEGASLQDGVLNIDLRRIIPEDKKPKKFEIS